MGSRRACYLLPDGRHCLKCYRSDDEIKEGKYPGDVLVPLSPATEREIRGRRFDERHNTSCQEYRYWLSLKRRLPADLMAVFPETVEQMLLPTRGWALMEELVVNEDGERSKGFAEEWHGADPETKARMLTAFQALADGLVKYAVRFYDPPNIMVQWLADGSFRLRIADFEPASRLLVPIDAIPFVTRLKVRRRFSRYLRNTGI